MNTISAVSNRMPPVAVEYTARGRRVRRVFADAYAARRFYVQQARAGRSPAVCKPLAEETTMAKQPQDAAKAMQDYAEKYAKAQALRTEATRAARAAERAAQKADEAEQLAEAAKMMAIEK